VLEGEQAVLRISQEQVDEALGLLSRLEPAPVALSWEFQDNATVVLFRVNVAEQSESSVSRTYFNQVVPPLCALFPESGDLVAWMVIFQDPTDHLITSCSVGDADASAL
jgi:hypothetical protein